MWIVLALIVVVLLFVFPRVILPVLAVALIAGTIAGVGYFRERQRQLDSEAAVAMVVRYDAAACSDQQPLSVVISNASERTIASIAWVFSARRQGYRGELTGPWLKEYRHDGPLAPGAQLQLCYPAPAIGEYAFSRDADRLENLALGIRSRRVLFEP
jgi:hypothetical protein